MALGLTIQEKQVVADSIEAQTGKKITRRQIEDDVQFLLYITSTLSDNTVVTKGLSILYLPDQAAVDAVQEIDSDVVVIGFAAAGGGITIPASKIKSTRGKSIRFENHFTSGADCVINVKTGDNITIRTSTGVVTNDNIQIPFSKAKVFTGTTNEAGSTKEFYSNDTINLAGGAGGGGGE